jgi:O-antigen/teichoic acid export membrane protein
LLFFSAPAISGFFNEPELTAILQVLGIVLIIDSLTLIQRTILTKRIDFKLQARISVIASIGSGVVAITMAFYGFGVWALVAQRIVKQGLNSLFLWMWNRWRPLLVFSKESFKELFGFGSKLLVGGLIDTIYRNVYYLIIGKFFSAQELGFYTKADDFQRLPSQNINAIISRVSYPILSIIQSDIPRLKNNYRKLIRTIMFITFILMMGMAAVAEPLIHTLIGAKWEPAIIYLQMLCFVGMMYPLHALNLNMLLVLGRSDLLLKLEVIKKIIAIPTIVIGVFFGIKMMIVGMIVNTLIAYYLNSYWSGVKIGYSFKHQVKDILPSFFLALSMGVIVYFIGVVLPFSYPVKLIIQIVFGGLFVLVISEVTKFRDYIFAKELVLEKIRSIKKI